MSIPRLAVISTAVPPAASGQSRVLGEIFSPGQVPPPVWFTDRLDLLEPGAERFGRHVDLGPPRFSLVGSRCTGRFGTVNNLAGLTSTVFERARTVARVLRGDPVQAIIGASGSPFDVPAAWIAARWLRLPFA